MQVGNRLGSPRSIRWRKGELIGAGESFRFFPWCSFSSLPTAKIVCGVGSAHIGAKNLDVEHDREVPMNFVLDAILPMGWAYDECLVMRSQSLDVEDF